MIQRLDNLNREAYNPIRPHIGIQFERCRTAEDCLDYVANCLHEKLNEQLSRVLVFVRTRRQAEDAAEALTKRLTRLKGKVGFFHAGLSADERDETVSDFKEENGRISILCTTKAFGMGMDIPNVHHVFHLGPSSSFEDFLQEIGRAGRDQGALQRAGLSEQNPIRTVCLLTPSDFSNLNDLLTKSQLGWSQIQKLSGAIDELFIKNKLPDGHTLPLPLSYHTQIDAFDEHRKNGSAETNFRLALHWLERLGRIELGYFLPAHLEFDTEPLRKFKSDHERIISDPLLVSLFAVLLKAGDLSQPVVTIPLHQLKGELKIRLTDSLFRLIALGQKNGYVRLNHTISVSEASGRQDELTYIAKENIRSHPSLEISLRLAEQLVRQAMPGQRVELGSEFFNEVVTKAIEEFFQPDRFPWLGSDKKKVKKVREGFLRKGRLGYARGLNGAFQIVRSMPSVRHTVQFVDGTVSQSIYRKEKSTNDEVRNFIENFRKDAHWLLNHIFTLRSNANGPNSRLDLTYVLLQISRSDLSYLEKLLSFLHRSRLIKVEGSLLPMAIELTRKDQREIDPDGDESDQKVYESFVQAQKLRRLRLVILAGVAEIDPGDYAAYINAYFQSENAEQILQILDQYLPSNSSLLSEYREEALKKAEDDLNAQQRAVYEFAINKNLNVVAGPGSGKTHTLTLRVARLIHREHIPPAQILVLAYNRAVVVELKERLRTLFKKLGYNRLTQGIKVFTFHGFIKFCLQEELDGVDFGDYATRFMQKWHTSPGLINARMGAVRYVFVDEFQDITSSRLEVLSVVANPEQQRCITVIGDPNQSIYGFDRKAEGDPISPAPFYKKFVDLFKPDALQLTVNYRSLPGIIEQAQAFVDLNTVTFGIPPLTAAVEIPNAWANKVYCETIKPSGDNWIAKTIDLLGEQLPTGEPYREVAIMFRSNDELYRAFNKLKSALPSMVRLRIQGATEDFLRIREIAFVIRGFILPKLEQPISESLHLDYHQFVTASHIPDAWDTYLLSVLEACLIEFGKVKDDGATHQDLLDFLLDLARKDDGQLSKLYHQNAAELINYSNQTTIVLTTMHKVKGLEFDAVVLPPSYALLPYTLPHEPPLLTGDDGFVDSIEEERRVRFVALSRAKFRLIVLPWEREAALEAGKSWALPDNMARKLGRPAPAGLDKFYIDWAASQPPSTLEYIHENVRVGEEVVLRPYFDKWNVIVGGRVVGRTKMGGMKGFSGASIRGFSVTNIIVRNYEETLLSDQNNATTFAKLWQPHAQKAGYTYIVDFAGYGTAV